MRTARLPIVLLAGLACLLLIAIAAVLATRDISPMVAMRTDDRTADSTPIPMAGRDAQAAPDDERLPATGASIKYRDAIAIARQTELESAAAGLATMRLMLGTSDEGHAAVLKWRERLRLSRGGNIRTGPDGEILPEDDERLGPLTVRERASLEKALIEAESNLQRIQSADYAPKLYLDITAMKPGDFGAPFRPSNYLGRPSRELLIRANVLQVVDDRNLIARFMSHDKPDFVFWLSDFATGGVVDGSGIDTSGMMFECVGTKQYATPIGSTRTVRHLRFMSRQ